jgi:hypothetical protein
MLKRTATARIVETEQPEKESRSYSKDPGTGCHSGQGPEMSLVIAKPKQRKLVF